MMAGEWLGLWRFQTLRIIIVILLLLLLLRIRVQRTRHPETSWPMCCDGSCTLLLNARHLKVGSRSAVKNIALGRHVLRALR